MAGTSSSTDFAGMDEAFQKNIQIHWCGEIVNEFLMSTGYLKGAHHESCPIHAKVLAQKPLWKKNSEIIYIGITTE